MKIVWIFIDAAVARSHLGSVEALVMIELKWLMTSLIIYWTQQIFDVVMSDNLIHIRRLTFLSQLVFNYFFAIYISAKTKTRHGATLNRWTGRFPELVTALCQSVLWEISPSHLGWEDDPIIIDPSISINYIVHTGNCRRSRDEKSPETASAHVILFLVIMETSIRQPWACSQKLSIARETSTLLLNRQWSLIGFLYCQLDVYCDLAGNAAAVPACRKWSSSRLTCLYMRLQWIHASTVSD